MQSMGSLRAELRAPSSAKLGMRARGPAGVVQSQRVLMLLLLVVTVLLSSAGPVSCDRCSDICGAGARWYALVGGDVS